MNQERIKIDGILLDTIKKNRKMIREDSSLPTNEDILKVCQQLNGSSTFTKH